MKKRLTFTWSQSDLYWSGHGVRFCDELLDLCAPAPKNNAGAVPSWYQYPAKFTITVSTQNRAGAVHWHVQNRTAKDGTTDWSICADGRLTLVPRRAQYSGY